MSDFDISLKGNQMSADARGRIIARVYAEIISWPDPRRKTNETVTDGDGKPESAPRAVDYITAPDLTDADPGITEDPLGGDDEQA